jgi:CRP/FNR family transcriptional regulator
MINIKKYFPNIYEIELQAAIQELGILNTFDEGTVIMDYGQYIKSLPMLMSGTIKILREDEEGREVFLYYLNAGETCAMSLTCCLAQQKSEIKAIAEENVKMINIPVKYMDEWMKKYDSWRTFVMQTYRNRFNELLHTIDSIAFMKMDQRLLKYLYDKVNHTNKHIFYTTHQAIAQEFNTSREVISRLLKQLEKEGKVELSRNKIKVLPPFEI